MMLLAIHHIHIENCKHIYQFSFEYGDILNHYNSYDSNVTFFHYIYKINYLYNLTSSFNNTVLICAVIKGHKEIVELLLRQEGIDINIQDILNQKHS